jgi:CheY-like chemotaxis protein
LLERQGYAVALARDGLEALAWLNQAYPVMTPSAADAECQANPDWISMLSPTHHVNDVAARPPVLILLDIEMPKMDGFELLAALRADPRWQQLPVAMMTSRTAIKHRDRAMQLGANAYVGKPYPEQDLISLIQSLQTAVV